MSRRQSGGKLSRAPAPPEGLGEEGSEFWNRYLVTLGDPTVLDALDLTVLETACELYEVGRMSWRVVQRQGALLPGWRGGVRKNPAMAIHLEFAREFRHYAKALSMIRDHAKERSEEPEGLGRYL